MCAKIIGRNLEVGVGIEKIRGTAQLTAEKWLKNVTANIIAKAEKATDDTSHNVLADSDNSRIVKKWVEGDIEGIMQADPLGYFLYNLYGTISSSSVGSGVYDHEFTLQNSIQHPSLTLFVKDGSVQQYSYDTGMLASFEISASVDDFVRFTASFMASGENSNSDTPSYSNEKDWIGKDITIKIADTEGELASAPEISIKELGLTFDTGLINDFVLGDYEPEDNYNTKMQIEGSITKNFDNTTFKDLFRGDDSKYMEIKIEGSEDIGGGSKATLTILLNKVQITEWDRSGGNDELVTENITFKAFYNETDDQQSKMTLRNNTSEYDTPISD